MFVLKILTGYLDRPNWQNSILEDTILCQKIRFFIRRINTCMNVKEFLQTNNWAIKLSKMSYGPRKMIENSIVFQTPFLPQSSTIQQRAWHILHEMNTVPV